MVLQHHVEGGRTALLVTDDKEVGNPPVHRVRSCGTRIAQLPRLSCAERHRSTTGSGALPGRRPFDGASHSAIITAGLLRAARLAGAGRGAPMPAGARASGASARARG